MKRKSRSKSRSKRTKSRSRSGSRSRSRKELPRFRPERGCTNQSHYKKYRSRPSPPYPANLCRSKVKIGNNGRLFRSEKRGRSRVYRWYPYK